MPEVRLNATDAAELTEMLQFISGWLTETRPPRRITGRVHRPPPAVCTNCAHDLERFTFLPGGGEQLFGP